jgi:hypothetical protein
MRIAAMGYLQRVNGIWRVRIPIPEDKRQFFNGKQTRTESLKTRSRAEAVRLAPGVIDQLQREIDDPVAIVRRLRPGLVNLEEIADFVAELFPDAPPPFTGGTPAGPEALKKAFADILENWNLQNSEPKAQRDMLLYTGKLEKFLGHSNAAAVTPDDLVNFRDYLLREAKRAGKDSTKSVQNCVSDIKSFFKFAMQYGIKPNPAAELVYRAPVRKGKAYSLDEVSRLLRAVVDQPDHIKYPVLLAAYGGFRVEEIVDAHRNDVEQIEGIWCLRVREDHRDENQKIKN